MSNRVYMYPMKEYEVLKNNNPYVYNLCMGLKIHFAVINWGKPRRGGVRDILYYINRFDILYLNWVEDVKTFQAISFLFIFLLCKILNKKIVWTHHNRQSHKGGSVRNKVITTVLKRFSTLIVAHTKESFHLLNKSETDKGIFYFFHPFFSKDVVQPSPLSDKEYDILIWGNVSKRKGVDAFLKFLKDSKKLDDVKIKVIGKFESNEYYGFFSEYFKGEGLDIVNSFVDDASLKSLHKKSSIVFFPYTGPSVLNSGALVRSVPLGTPVIGPNLGGFKDLAQLQLINVYNDFNDVLDFLKLNKVIDYPFEKIENFCEEHSWENFSFNLYCRLMKK